MSRYLTARILPCVIAISLSACSGSGAGSGGSAALPGVPDAVSALNAQREESAASSARSAVSPTASATALPIDKKITIQGVVTETDTVPYFHVVLQLASGQTIAVYTSEVPNAKVGDTVWARGYVNSEGNFQASSARIVAGTPPPGATSTPAPGASATPQPISSSMPSPGVSATPNPVSSPTPGPVPSASPVPSLPPTAGIPYHIPTWAYDGGYAANSISAASVAKLVSYAEGSKSVADCHSTSPASCVALMYFDPNMLYYSKYCAMNDALIASLPEEAFLHYATGGQRIGNANVIWCGGATRSYYSNGNSAALQAAEKSYLNKNDSYDAYFMDDTGHLLQNLSSGGAGMCPNDGHPYSFCWNTAEYHADADVSNSRISLAKALTHINGVPAKLVYNGGDLALYNGTPNNYIGKTDEAYVVSNGQVRPTMYARTLNDMAVVNATNGFLTLMAKGSANPVARIVQTAVIQLGFSPGHTVDWEDLESGPSALAVYPEELIYPTQPLQSMTNSNTDLAVANGVWRREFAACYYKSAPIGHCAVVLTSGGSRPLNATWFRQTYGHGLTLTGGDVLSGGAVNLSAKPTSVPNYGAVLLAQ